MRISCNEIRHSNERPKRGKKQERHVEMNVSDKL